MKISDFVNVTKNKRNNQVSFNLKARQLAKIGITPQYLLDLKLPKKSSFKPIKSIIIQKGVRSKWKK